MHEQNSGVLEYKKYCHYSLLGSFFLLCVGISQRCIDGLLFVVITFCWTYRVNVQHSSKIRFHMCSISRDVVSKVGKTLQLDYMLNLLTVPLQAKSL